MASGVVEIYALCCPDTGCVRYIGKAIDSEERLKGHFRDMRRRDYPVYRWMKKLASNGKKPFLRVINIVKESEWRDAEKKAISEHKQNGMLLNVADGGDEPYCSKEQRAINGKLAAIKRTSTPEKAEAQALKRKGVSVVRWLKESGQWDKERGMRIRLAMKNLALIDSRFSVWEVTCEL